MTRSQIHKGTAAEYQRPVVPTRGNTPLYHAVRIDAQSEAACTKKPWWMWLRGGSRLRCGSFQLKQMAPPWMETLKCPAKPIPIVYHLRHTTADRKMTAHTAVPAHFSTRLVRQRRLIALRPCSSAARRTPDTAR
jgi:hypothetical protein